jgi:GNAT superfamily N-acetyltransferase
VSGRSEIVVRQTRREDFPGIARLTELVYPGSPPWSEVHLDSHLHVFPEGQFVAVREPQGEIVGMAASLIILWDDYHVTQSWADFTARGTFTNHDSERGHTLYGAEVMVRPDLQRRGVGKKIYQARRDLCRRLGLLRIRAGSRLRGYHQYAGAMTAREYTIAVIRGEISDATLTFQLRQGFRVLAVVDKYLAYDPESLGYAAVIEWINREVAKPADYAGRDPDFRPPPRGSRPAEKPPPDSPAENPPTKNV